MTARRRCARVSVPIVACLALLAFAAPSAVAHPEECAGGAAAWASLIPWSDTDFAAQAACGTARLTASAAADLAPGETDGRNLRLIANTPKAAPFNNPGAVNSDLAFWG